MWAPGAAAAAALCTGTQVSVVEAGSADGADGVAEPHGEAAGAAPPAASGAAAGGSEGGAAEAGGGATSYEVRLVLEVSCAVAARWRPLPTATLPLPRSHGHEEEEGI